MRRLQPSWSCSPQKKSKRASARFSHRKSTTKKKDDKSETQLTDDAGGDVWQPSGGTSSSGAADDDAMDPQPPPQPPPAGHHAANVDQQHPGDGGSAEAPAKNHSESAEQVGSPDSVVVQPEARLKRKRASLDDKAKVPDSSALHCGSKTRAAGDAGQDEAPDDHGEVGGDGLVASGGGGKHCSETAGGDRRPTKRPRAPPASLATGECGTTASKGVGALDKASEQGEEAAHEAALAQNNQPLHDAAAGECGDVADEATAGALAPGCEDAGDKGDADDADERGGGAQADDETGMEAGAAMGDDEARDEAHCGGGSSDSRGDVDDGAANLGVMPLHDPNRPLPPWAEDVNSNDITEEEKLAVPEFFCGRPIKTPQRYLGIRKHLQKLWESHKPRYLKKSSCLGIKGDVNAIGRVHAYLETIGVINVGYQLAGCQPTPDHAPAAKAAKLPKPKPPAVKDRTDKDRAGDMETEPADKAAMVEDCSTAAAAAAGSAAHDKSSQPDADAAPLPAPAPAAVTALHSREKAKDAEEEAYRTRFAHSMPVGA